MRVQQITDEEFQQYVRPKPPVSEDPTARSRQQNEHTAQLLQKYEEEKARTFLIKNPDATKDEVFCIAQFATEEQAKFAINSQYITIASAKKAGNVFYITDSFASTKEVSSQVSEQKQLVDAIM